MTPLRLVVQAFGPFARAVTVDFRELAGRGMFLITGPTGAGKTTLLDGATFALFGETSGGDRKAAQMRSQHADPALATEVTFDFALGSEVYRVTRRPVQDRPAKRGEGMVTEPPKATLWCRTGLADDSEEGTVLAARPQDVDAEVERLLGFSGDQFRQVVLLPQGKFRKFLESTSSDREEILEALFRTDVHRRVEEALREKSKSLETDLREQRIREETLFRGAPAGTREELEAKGMLAGQRAEDQATRAAALGERLTAIEAELRVVRELAAKFAELDLARAGLAAAEAGSDEHAARQEEVRRARAALPLVELEKQAAARAAEADRATAERRAFESELGRAEGRKAAAESALAAEEGRAGRRAEVESRVHALEGMAQAVRDLDGLRTEAARLEAERARSVQRRDDAERRAKSAREEAERKGLEVAGAESEAKLESALRGLLDEAVARGKAGKRLEELKSGLPSKRRAAQAADLAEGRARQTLAQAKSRLEALEAAWAEGQAAHLALGLEDGKPCAVCGSTEHPAPAEISTAVPEQAEVRSAKSAAEALEKRLEESREAGQAARQALGEAEAGVRALEESAGPEGGPSEADLRERVAKAEESARRLPGLAKELAALREAERKAVAELDALRESCEAAGRAADGARAVLRDREQAIPEPFREPGAAEAALEAARAVLERLRRALEAARKAAEAARVAVAQAEASLRSSRESAARAEELAQDAGRRFSEGLELAGFGAPSDYRKAKRTEAEIAALEARNRKFEAALHDAKGRLVRAEQAVEGLERRDPAPLEAEQARVRLERDVAVRGEAAARAEAESIARLLEDLARIGARKAALEREYAVHGRLAEVAAGANPLRITFQRFVLRSLLQDVLVAASRRLRLMSRGRYDLQVAGRREDGRAAGGLELEVADSYTGGARPVTTLSGGEGFLASLALALGLADVVQARSGGIRLDAVFVDEGFGSLDEEVLELSIRVLNDLREGGRLVGIISHVQELKERISTRLEVVPERESSSARFVLG